MPDIKDFKNKGKNYNQVNARVSDEVKDKISEFAKENGLSLSGAAHYIFSCFFDDKGVVDFAARSENERLVKEVESLSISIEYLERRNKKLRVQLSSGGDASVAFESLYNAIGDFGFALEDDSGSFDDGSYKPSESVLGALNKLNDLYKSMKV